MPNTHDLHLDMRFFLLAAMVLIAACASKDTPPDGAPLPKGTLEFVRADGTMIRSIEIEIAEDEASRQQGLMHRRQMTLNQGMLFLFEEPDNLSFWMANTPMPLDIMFVAADSEIVNIAKRTKPLSQERIKSTDLAQYVVEVRGGFSDRFGIDETASVRWQRNE